jgi:hypothetical protein
METPVVLLRNSERSTYRRCRQRWVWNYVEERSPLRSKPALEFGTLIHKALEARYPPGVKRGPHPADTFVELYEQAIEETGEFGQYDEDGERVNARELGIAMCKGYVEFWGDEKDWESLVPEMPFAIDIVDEHGNYIVTLVGSMDSVLRHRKTKKIKIEDYKTAKSIDMKLRPNSGYGEQGMTYWWAATITLRHEGILKPKQQIDILEFDWLRKGLPDTRPVNEKGLHLNLPSKDNLLDACNENLIYVPKRATKETLIAALSSAGWTDGEIASLGEVSKVQPGPLFHRTPFVFGPNNLTNIAKRIRMEAQEMAMVRRGELEVFTNPTKDCSWDCAFVEPCEMKEMGGAWKDMLALEFGTWEPYAHAEGALD